MRLPHARGRPRPRDRGGRAAAEQHAEGASSSKAFLALTLRAGSDGARYQLAVYPTQRKAQLRKILSDGSVRYLHIEKNVGTIKGLDQPNELRLRAFNVTTGAEKGSAASSPPSEGRWSAM